MKTNVLTVNSFITIASVASNNPDVETIPDNGFLSPVTTSQFFSDIGVINAIDWIVDGCIPQPIEKGHVAHSLP